MIHIDKQSTIPIYLQLYECIRKDILSGALRAGDPLPATRKLAADFGISRNTVNNAYAQLLAEGYLQSKIGSGYSVCNIDWNLLPQSTPIKEKQQNYAANQEITDENPEKLAHIQSAFEYGPIDNAIYPMRQWRKSLAVAMDQIDTAKTRFYPKRSGTTVLQTALAHYLEINRGIHCRPQQIVITCGIQHSMEILANMFGNNKSLAIEEPGYDGTRKIFENHHYDILPIPVGEDGVAVEKLSSVKADLLFLTPSHQFPTGAILPIGKRIQVLNWAAKQGCYIIEDDYVNELRYQTAPLPSLYALDSAHCVIYAGTFAKSLAPDLRVAYLVLPEPLLPIYQAYYWRYNSQVSALMQYALANFISSGEYAKHIHRLRTYYRKKQQALCQAVETVFGSKASIYGKGAGLHILLQVQTGLSSKEMVQSAKEHGILVYPIEQHFIQQKQVLPSTVLLGLSYTPTEQYLSCMQKLYTIWLANENHDI